MLLTAYARYFPTVHHYTVVVSFDTPIIIVVVLLLLLVLVVLLLLPLPLLLLTIRYDSGYFNVQ